MADDFLNIDPETGEVLPPEGIDANGAPSDGLTVIESETLFGDVRDALLSRFRNAPKPWAQMSEDEQRQTIEAFNQTARHVVREAVRLTTAFEWPRCVAKLGSVNIKDKETIEAKVIATNISDYRDTLAEHVGDYVMILAVDSETFMSERSEPRADPDQLGFDLDQEDSSAGDDEPERF